MEEKVRSISGSWPARAAGRAVPAQAVVIPAAGPILCADATEFRNKYNSKPFQFRHNLAESPLFELPRLASVAQLMLERGDLSKFVARSAKTALADARFKDMPLEEKLAVTVRQLGQSQVWLKLTSVNNADPEYDQLLKKILGELEVLSGQPLSELITWSSMTVFLASPNVTTPYHIDHESNFLFQIYGAKDLSLHNPGEPDIVPEEQLENFYAGDFEAAQYRPELQHRGTIFRMEPGVVVHHPPLAPHWVQNGDQVSVSVSIGFCMKDIDRRARVYQVNHFLRRFGMKPSPPGKSKLGDALKIASVGMVSKANPTTPDEILFSGMNRMLEPPRAIKRWVRALRNAP